jgi:tetratricopeptide (TPR) repeat protein
MLQLFCFRLLVSILMLAPAVGAFAQNLPELHEPFLHFQRGFDLFEKAQYGAAQQRFLAYEADAKLREDPQARVRLADAQFYAALCAFHLLHADAVKRLRQFIDEYPTHAQTTRAHFYLGKLYYIRKHYARAAEYLANIDPNRMSADEYDEGRFMLGYAWFAQGKEEDALGVLESLVGHKGPHYERANYYYGILKYRKGDYAGALQPFQRIEQAPLYELKVPIYLTNILLRLQEWDQLDRYGSRLLKQNKEYDEKPLIYQQIGFAFFDKGDYKRAKPYFEGYLETTGKANAAILYRLGYCHYRLKEYAPAIFYFNKVAAGQDSVGQAAAYYMAYAYVEQGKLEDARLAYKHAASILLQDDFRREALLQFAKVSLETRYYTDALSAFRRYIKDYPNDPRTDEIRGLVGEVLFYSGQYRAALDYFDKSKRSDARTRLVHQKTAYYYALDLAKNNKPDSADVMFQLAASLGYDTQLAQDAAFWRAEVHYRNRQFALAEKAYREFIDRPQLGAHPKVGAAWYGMAWCALNRKNYSAAADRFDQALQTTTFRQQPDLYIDAALRAGDASFVAKNYKRAAAFYQTAFEFNHGFRDYALFRMGICRLRMGQHEAGIADLNRLATDFPQSELADEALYQIASTYIKWKNDYSRSIEYSQRLIANYPKSSYVPHALNNLGFAYQANNRKADAMAQFKRVIDEHGHHTEQCQIALDELSNLLSVDELNQLVDNYRRRYPNAALRTDNITFFAARDLLEEKNDPTAAIKQLTKYLNDYPNGRFASEALLLRGEAYLAQNQTDQALADFEALGKPGVANDIAARALGKAAAIYLERKSYPKASENYALALKRTENNFDRFQYQYGYGQSLMAEKKYADAQYQFAALLRNPSTTEFTRVRAQLQLATAWYHTGKRDSALQQFRVLEKENKNAIGAESQYMICKILFDQQQYDEAQREVFAMKDKFAAQNHWKARAFLILADVYRVKGELFQASQTLKSLVEYAPDAEVKAEASRRLEQVEKLMQEPETEASRFSNPEPTPVPTAETGGRNTPPANQPVRTAEKPSTKAMSAPPAGFYLIVENTTGQTKAELRTDDWKQQGFDARMFPGTNPDTWRISVFYSTKREEVENRRKLWNQQGLLPSSAWIYQQK